MSEHTYIHSRALHPYIQQQQEEEFRSMACVAADREAAMREVAHVYELIKIQQPLLLLHSQQPPPSSTTQLAQSLLGKALRALNVALSVMKQQEQPVIAVKAEPQLSPPSPASADSQAAIAPSTAIRGSKRRSSVTMEAGKKKKTSSSWATVTSVPYDDGYEWRKYGEKKINGTLFTRSYFRCTYKDEAGCPATKHVQQMDNNSDQPMFHVIYNNDHTCNTSSKAAAIANNTGSSSSSNLAALLAAGCCNGSGSGSGSGSGKGLTTINAGPTGHAAAMNMKQEPPLLLPALIDLQPSACFPYEQIPQCQRESLVATSMEQKFVYGALRDHDSPFDGEIPSATGSCISGETSWWDGDMAAQIAPEDDPLHGLDLFVLQCDSFIDY